MTNLGVRAALIGVLVSAVASTSGGQLPQPPIGALEHRVWTIRDGAPTGVRALAQSADGVLWIGGATGLYRFDGVRFEPFPPSGSQPLPSLWINTLLALPDSTLWIGYSGGGISVLGKDRLVSYSQRDGLPEGTVTGIARDSTGAMWAVREFADDRADSLDPVHNRHMLRSMRVTSGRCSRYAPTASRPLEAVATSWKSGQAPINAARPPRKIGWSSTVRRRMGEPPPGPAWM